MPSGAEASAGIRLAADAETAIAAAQEGEIGMLLALLRRHAADRWSLEALVRRLTAPVFTRLLERLDPANAALILAYLAELTALHHTQALLALSETGFEGLIRLLTLLYLLRDPGTQFNRRSWLRALLQDFARQENIPYSKMLAVLVHAVTRLRRRLPTAAALPGLVAELAAELPEDDRAMFDTPPAGRAPDPVEAATDSLPTLLDDLNLDPSATDGPAPIEHFLLTGQPSRAGQGLAKLARDDPEGLASLIRRLARDRPSAVPAVLERLLGWLLPGELLDCLAPDQTARALRWADALAGSALAAWQEVFAALLRNEAAPFLFASGGAGRRLDRLALLAHWLDHGEVAWWAPAEVTQAALLADLSNRPLAELQALFMSADRERTVARLQLAVAALGPDRGMRLLQRLAPWATDPAGPLAAMLKGLDDMRRLGVLLRATADGLSGAALDLHGMTREVPPAPPPPVQAAGAPAPVSAVTDRARLFAWLDEADRDTPAPAGLVRLLARLADADDRELAAYFRARLAQPEARARWAALLPDEVMGRIVHLLVPAQARFLLDSMLLLAVAWRQTSTPSERGGEPGLPWTQLLALLAKPGPVDAGAVAHGLVISFAGGDPDRAATLRSRAELLARTGGYVSVLAALRRAPAKAEPPRSTPPRRTGVDAPASLEPGSTIYVGNAGLVLLNPYLPVFFDRLGLLNTAEDGRPRILGLEAASRGVHLLQYLVDARLDRTEPELVLNKLLCGLAPAQPVAPSIEAAQADLDICDSLLQAVIANWPIICNTSPAGLRETFLQREGRLLREESRWSLQVQRKTLDVLTDQIQWSFLLVYHRWMIDPIHVTW